MDGPNSDVVQMEKLHRLMKKEQIVQDGMNHKVMYALTVVVLLTILEKQIGVLPTVSVKQVK